MQVLSTFLPTYCIAANIAGDAADVQNLLPPGVGPHDYQFSPRDIGKLKSSHLIVMNGLGIESWLHRSIENLSAKEMPHLVETATGLGDRLIAMEDDHHHGHGHDHDHGHHHGHYDPHVWMDPTFVAHGVTNVLKAFQEADPRNAEIYEKNAFAYVERLHALDREIAELLKPVQGESFVTFHDAFAYFINRYKLTLAGVIEETPDVSPSAKQLSALYDTIRQTEAKVIFTEPQFSDKLAKRISADLSVKLGQLDTLETGDLIPTAYETALRRNAETLVKELK